VLSYNQFQRLVGHGEFWLPVAVAALARTQAADQAGGLLHLQVLHMAVTQVVLQERSQLVMPLV
jgi:hypothetical protein